MLIAIMANTFERVTEISQQSKLKEMCAMISENEFVLKREEEFKDSKYIIIARLEKARENQDGENMKVTSIIKNHLQNEMREMKKDYRALNEVSKDEMIANIKSIESKLIEQ